MPGRLPGERDMVEPVVRLNRELKYKGTVISIYQDTVIANGNEAHFKNGILRPFFEVHRSDHDAIIGSVNASKILPNAVIPPIIVKIPSTTSPCGINTVCPWLIDA